MIGLEIFKDSLAKQKKQDTLHFYTARDCLHHRKHADKMCGRDWQIYYFNNYSVKKGSLPCFFFYAQKYLIITHVPLNDSVRK